MGKGTSDASDDETVVDAVYTPHEHHATEAAALSRGDLLQDGIAESIGLLERLASTLLDHEPHDFLERGFKAKVVRSLYLRFMSGFFTLLCGQCRLLKHFRLLPRSLEYMLTSTTQSLATI